VIAPPGRSKITLSSLIFDEPPGFSKIKEESPIKRRPVSKIFSSRLLKNFLPPLPASRALKKLL
jgi:hypothetical protein